MRFGGGIYVLYAEFRPADPCARNHLPSFLDVTTATITDVIIITIIIFIRSSSSQPVAMVSSPTPHRSYMNCGWSGAMKK